MRLLLAGLIVLVSLVTSRAAAGADAACGGWFQISCEDLAKEQERLKEENARYDEEWEQERLDQRYREAEEADQWADAYLSAEKAAAVYWRDPYVELDPMKGTRRGRLGTPDGRFIYPRFTCDIEYRDAQSGGCVPADRDYDCAELRSWGIVNIPVTKSQYSGSMPALRGDWMLLDDDNDGMGCEYVPAS